LPVLGFCAVNRPGRPGYIDGLQRHHLLPRQLLSQTCFAAMIEGVGRQVIGFDDFRCNGMLLPGTEQAARRTGLPLHRGPHRSYNAMVIERVGQVEATWSRRRTRAANAANREALERLRLLERALRRRLLQPARRPLMLNRHDPLGGKRDFAVVDAMLDDFVDVLWPATDTRAEAMAPAIPFAALAPIAVI
jgi:hypothetical protein